MGDIFNTDFEIESLSKVLKPFLFYGFRKGIEQGQQTVSESDVFTESVKKALTEKSMQHASLVIGTTKDQLQKQFTEAFENGEGIQDVARRINALYGKTMGPRSKLIARTELTGVINDGTLRTLVKEGYTQKEWSTAMDGRERETHAAANGQVVGIYETFTIGSSRGQAPGDPDMDVSEIANCRCTLVGAGVPEDRKRKLNESFLRIHGSLEKKLVVQLHHEFDRQRRRVLSHFPT